MSIFLLKLKNYFFFPPNRLAPLEFPPPLYPLLPELLLSPPERPDPLLSPPQPDLPPRKPPRPPPLRPPPCRGSSFLIGR